MKDNEQEKDSSPPESKVGKDCMDYLRKIRISMLVGTYLFKGLGM